MFLRPVYLQTWVAKVSFGALYLLVISQIRLCLVDCDHRITLALKTTMISTGQGDERRTAHLAPSPEEADVVHLGSICALRSREEQGHGRDVRELRGSGFGTA